LFRSLSSGLPLRLRRRFGASIVVSLCGLCAVAAICAQRVAQDGTATIRHAPQPRSGHFLHQATHVQSIEHSSNRRALTLPTTLLLHAVIQGQANVLVAKALADVVARQHGSEQTDFLCARWVEARVTAALLALRFGQSLQIVVARRRIIDRRQCFQVTLVARPRRGVDSGAYCQPLCTSETN